MEQRDINSRTRADTFGLRPDLYDALSGNMVKKEDLTAIGGSLGYASILISKSTEVSVRKNTDTRLPVSLSGESKGVSIAELNGRGKGLLLENGIWIITESITTRASGTSSYSLVLKNEWCDIATGNGLSDATVPQFVNVPFFSSIPRSSYSHTFLTVVDSPQQAICVIAATADTDSATVYNSTMTLLRIQ